MTTTPRSDWLTDALCAEVGGTIFFPPKGASADPARSICNRCAVVSECLTDALRDDRQVGIRGGLTERERRQMKQNGGEITVTTLTIELTMKGAA